MKLEGLDNEQVKQIWEDNKPKYQQTLDGVAQKVAKLIPAKDFDPASQRRALDRLGEFKDYTRDLKDVESFVSQSLADLSHQKEGLFTKTIRLQDGSEINIGVQKQLKQQGSYIYYNYDVMVSEQPLENPKHIFLNNRRSTTLADFQAKNFPQNNSSSITDLGHRYITDVIQGEGLGSAILRSYNNFDKAMRIKREHSLEATVNQPLVMKPLINNLGMYPKNEKDLQTFGQILNFENNGLQVVSNPDGVGQEGCIATEKFRRWNFNTYYEDPRMKNVTFSNK